MKSENNKISNKKGAVLWMTGLSGSGKSTIGDHLFDLLEKKGVATQRLDGDIFRNYFGDKLSFNKEDRDFNIKMAAFTASMLEKHGVLVIASFISPYINQREFVRNLSENFIEVYINSSIDVCIKRDVKGLYKKAMSGEIKNFTGISDPYEEPKNPHLVIKTDEISIESSVDEIISYLIKEKYII